MQSQVILADPFKCRMWDYADRAAEFVTERSCALEIESFKAHGQKTPVLGRPARDPAYDAEIVFGQRRLFVARLLCQPLLVELRHVSDREAAIEMDAENRLRKDISAYERGVSYKALLRGGLFSSQDELARELSVSKAKLSRLLRFADLPAAIIEAFPSPLDIREAWAVELANAIADTRVRARMLQKARRIRARTPRPVARVVFSDLMADQSSRAEAAPRRVEQAVSSLMSSCGRRVLARVTKRRNGIYIAIRAARTPHGLVDELAHWLRARLE